MAGNVPTEGERVLYYVTETETVGAIVLRVTFWDLVDMRILQDPKAIIVRPDGAELGRGTVLTNVRRILGMNEGELNAGRFDRILND